MTPEQIQLIDKDINLVRATKISELLNKYIDIYKLPENSVAPFIANVMHESGSFSIKTENMNYTTLARLVEIWKTRFTLNPTKEPNKKDANLYVRNPKKLANLVYANRMGNVQVDDGYTFRGGGFAQITGRDSYTLFTAYVNRRDLTQKNINEVSALVQMQDDWAMDSALWFFVEFKKLVGVTDFITIVKRWNGGTIGLADRKNKYIKALEILS